MKGTKFLLIALILLTLVWIGDSLPLGACGEASSERHRSSISQSSPYRRYRVPRRLDAFQFQTPLDREFMEKLERMFNQRFVRKLSAIYFDIVEPPAVAHILTVGVEVTDRQFPTIKKMVDSAAVILRLERIPRVFIIADESMNAYVTNVKNPILVLHSELIEKCSPTELFFIIGHELGHIKCNHVAYKGLVSAITHAAGAYVGKFLNRTLTLLLLKWSRESEISADRAGLIVCQNRDVACRALIRLRLGLARHEMPHEIQIDEYLKQREEIERDAYKTIAAFITEICQPHPFISTRLKHLRKYFHSHEYRAIF